MPHSSDLKLIVPFDSEGDPLRQTQENRRKKNSCVIKQVCSTFLCRGESWWAWIQWVQWKTELTWGYAWEKKGVDTGLVLMLRTLFFFFFLSGGSNLENVFVSFKKTQLIPMTSTRYNYVKLNFARAIPY